MPARSARIYRKVPGPATRSARQNVTSDLAFARLEQGLVRLVREGVSMSMTSGLLRRAAVSVCASLLAGSAFAATYLPISDAELTQRSPVIVRAHVDSVETRL